MRPHPAFRADPDTALDRVAAIGFAHVVAVTPAGPMVAHPPVTRHGDRLRFHAARGNRITPHLDGAAVRATAKLSQNKTPADRAEVVAGLAASGDAALADAMAAA